MLFHKGKLVIPSITNLHATLLQEAHETPTSGHGGYLKTLKWLTEQFYWPQMKDVKLHVQQSLTFQKKQMKLLLL